IITRASINRLDRKSFEHLTEVTQVVLSHNNISEIENGTFAHLQNLQYLDLRQNNLRCLHDGTFRGPSNLRVLKLDQNNIFWISGTAFLDLPALQWISLSGNPLQCDCHLAAVMRIFVESYRQTVFTSAGIICDKMSAAFPGAAAAEVLGLLHCPQNTLPPAPPVCKKVISANAVSSCQSVCKCDASGFVSCVGKNLYTVPSDLPENIISLNIADNRLTSLPKKAFSKYSSLRKLNIEGNRIQEISPHAFSGLNRLSSLYLTANRIHTLLPNTFKGLSSLTILYLQKNNISCIGARFFDGLTNLRILHLSDNLIDNIEEDAFANLKQLRYLYLGNNLLTCDCSLAWLPGYLKQTEAGENHWATCNSPAELKGQYLQNLNLQICPPSSNKRQCKGVASQHHHSLPQRDLDVARGCPKACACVQIPNRVHRSADDVITFTAIRPSITEILEPSLKITCSNAGLTRFPVDIPENTKELYLDHNSIQDLNQRNFLYLQKLEVLSLHHNQITYISNDAFANLPRLKVLLLHSNHIQCIGASAFDIRTLKLISFDENPLRCSEEMSWLPGWMHRNEALVMQSSSVPKCAGPAHLQGSPIASLIASDFRCSHQNSTNSSCEKGCFPSKVTATTAHCPDACTCKGQRVDCSGKGLSEVPKDLPVNTKDLFLEHNNIRRIDPERLYHLKHLETLLLSHNAILELHSGTFKHLHNLKSLLLSSNGLRCIHPDAFVGLKKLRVLILQNNAISTLANSTFRDLGRINNLALGQNPLHCDCNLRWLNDFFKLKYLDNGVSLCASPHKLKLKSIFHLSPSNFTCTEKRGFRDTEKALKQINQDEDSEIVAKCNPCAHNPCQNNGKCEPISGVEFKCKCEAPFYGERCEQEMDACFGKPCKNGGTCKLTNDRGHYRCECLPGFVGFNCEENVNDCAGVLCENGGICVDGVNNYTCECAPGFRGRYCENVFQYCVDENPCKNDGVCVMHNSFGFKCICPEGWGGDDCARNLNDCEYNRCQNGGVCRDHVGGYTCECRLGFTGDHCEDVQVARTATIRNSASFGCDFNRCLNGATCRTTLSPLGYNCQCPLGYAGTFCEKVHSLSITSKDAHVSVQPPSRGCFFPRGNISLAFATSQQHGILLYFTESEDVGESLHRFLALELYRGYVKISLALGAGNTALAYSISKLADEKLHRLDVVIKMDQAELFVDGIRNALIQATVPKTNSDKKPRPLLSAAPIYLGGAPRHLLRAAHRAGLIGDDVGVATCVKSFFINEQVIDFSPLMHNFTDLKVGCGLISATETSFAEPNTKALRTRSKSVHESQQEASTTTGPDARDCRDEEMGCLNGGVCISGFALPADGRSQQWLSPSRYFCRCSSGYEGVRCEKIAYCRRHSRYSYLHDPDTGCISTQRVVIHSCSGSCQNPASTMLLWHREQQRKRRWQNQARRRIRRHRRQWSPSAQMSVSNKNTGLSRVIRRDLEGGLTCCQPIRFKQRNVQFRCPQSSGGRMYSRWFRFVRKCGCSANCDSGQAQTTSF
uniref:Protein slit n=1 Tax=Mesocestoides corti TaxID=53468 RepID=A0A5K3EG44_MESCO